MVFRAERIFIVGALLLMSVVVFLDVIYRTFAGDENKGVHRVRQVPQLLRPRASSVVTRRTSAWRAGSVRLVGRIHRARRTRHSHRWAVTRRCRCRKRSPFRRSGVVAVYGLIRLFLRPGAERLIWAQNLALVLTLWVGFLAASVCTLREQAPQGRGRAASHPGEVQAVRSLPVVAL